MFYGVRIMMYWTDHAPPHFHAMYGADEASIEIRSLVVVRGSLPPRALALTLEWAALHREELLEDWQLCATKQMPKRIPPLD
jgi:hypothetical protein